jgi:hypothetical protein
MFVKKIFMILAIVQLSKSKSEMAGDVHIWEPTGLRNIYSAKPIEYAIANFGTVPYGHSIYGNVFKATPLDACSPLSPMKWDKNSGTMIIYVERGNCHFAEKVLAAQKAGAGMVIIGDTSEEDVRKIMPVERTFELISQINIPSILINKEDAENFKRVLESDTDKEISLAVNFQLVKRTDRSNIKMILQTDDYRSYEAVTQLKNYYKSFEKYMELTIHYKIFKNLPLVFDPQNCVEIDALYCVLNTSGKKDANLLQETLKQICLFNDDFDKYIYYMDSVRRNCFDASQTINDSFSTCTKGIFESQYEESSRSKLSNCWDPKSAKAKEIFENNNDKIKYNLINYSPITFINGYFYKGNYQDLNHLMESFCNSFETPPSDCAKLDAFQKYNDSSASGIINFVIKSLLLAFGVMLVGVVVFYFFYRKRISGEFKVELDKKINEALAKYYAGSTDEYHGVNKE